MKLFYLIMSIIGCAVPNYFALKQSFATGNWLLWRHPAESAALAFQNPVSSAFVSDLFILLLVALTWMVAEANRLDMKRRWVYLLLSPLFGLAFALPLFLYFRQVKLSRER